MKKTNIVSLFVVGLLVLSVGLIYQITGDDEVPIEYNDIQTVEKIPLYYNIDNPDVIYTRNKLGEFEEIKIDG